MKLGCARRNFRPAAGFTLIELTLAIVIVGILAAMALPKFTSVQDETKVLAGQHLAGALEEASHANMLAKKTGKPGAIIVNQTNPCLQPLVERFVTSPLNPLFTVEAMSTGADEVLDCSGSREYGQCILTVWEGEDPFDITPFKVYCAR